MTCLVCSLLQVVVDPPPTAAIADPNQLRVGARVWLKDKDVYGFVRYTYRTCGPFILVNVGLQYRRKPSHQVLFPAYEGVANHNHTELYFQALLLNRKSLCQFCEPTFTNTSLVHLYRPIGSKAL